jgi:pimeloyl-ACP methyl ester carboxylesterase
MADAGPVAPAPSAKKEDGPKEKSKKAEEAPPRPISPVRLVLFVLRVAALSAVAVALVVLLLGWKHVTSSGAAGLSPTSLPVAVSRHLEQGEGVPIYDGSRSLTLFAVRKGAANGSEETVLFLHDLPGSSLSFSGAQDELARSGVASLAFDLPGFGLSDKPVGPSYSIDYLARATKELLSSLHVDAAHVVARGASCFVAARLAEQWPHLISSVVLLDCSPPPTRSPNLALFAFEHSPALPLWAHGLLFGSPQHDSAEVAAANRWLTVYKGGQERYFAYCTSGGQSTLGDEPFSGLCGRSNCAVSGYEKPIAGMVELAKGKTLGQQLLQFVEQLPRSARQNKAARVAPRVQYVAPSGDKYGAHDHGAHGHAAHSGEHEGHEEHEGHGHQHGAQCNH